LNTHKHTPLPFLIVGQGIAGTLLSYFLLQKKHPFKVVDVPLPGSTSSIAAGVINPITGRRMVKSWRFDELSTFAKITYEEIGQFLGVDLFRDMNILRALPTTFDENEWDRRSGFSENLPFFSKEVDLGNYKDKIPDIAHGEITGSAKVDLPLLIQTFRAYLIRNDLILDEKFSFGNLAFNSESTSYNGNDYDKIIFCEGFHASYNPFFNYLPFSLSKGELLLVRIKGLNVDKMLKNKIYIVPVKEDIYWVGSTNSFDYQGIDPTISQKESLKNTLSNIIKLPFEILSHQAGIRPTVADKRPLLGLHPKFKNLAIFNGLGTKGSSLGPFFAQQMAGFLLNINKLDPTVDIERFYQKLSD
jgi:glycine/D-amino acid oxidase-like deaminating enzyme